MASLSSRVLSTSIRKTVDAVCCWVMEVGRKRAAGPGANFGFSIRFRRATRPPRRELVDALRCSGVSCAARRTPELNKLQPPFQGARTHARDERPEHGQ